MRNKSLDAAKAIAAFLVVFIHISFPGMTGRIIKTLARSAVPFFFMVSGFFCYYGEKSAATKIPGKIVHILRITVFSLLFYLLWGCLVQVMKGQSGFKWAGKICCAKSVRDFFLFNFTSPIKPHLWFLPALIYCYCLDYMIEKFHMRKVAFILLPVLTCILVWRGQISRFFGIIYPVREYRNFLFTGMTFYLLGKLIHVWKEKGTSKLSPALLVTAGAAGAGISIGECVFLGDREIYVGTVFFTVSVFLYCIFYGQRIKVQECLSKAGKKLTLPLYLFHPAVIDAVRIVAGAWKIEDNPVYLWSSPIIVCIVTVWLIFAVDKVWSLMKKCGIVFGNSEK
ncbi:MAG: acyltransferase [Clostridia bacterium]|nr:acyltransferase [Clostridia bacterium]MDY5554746.1 acyltransferase [Blautia sp.]